MLLFFFIQTPHNNPWKCSSLDEVINYCAECRSGNQWVPFISLMDRWCYLIHSMSLESWTQCKKWNWLSVWIILMLCHPWCYGIFSTSSQWQKSWRLTWYSMNKNFFLYFWSNEAAGPAISLPHFIMLTKNSGKNLIYFYIGICKDLFFRGSLSNIHSLDSFSVASKMAIDFWYWMTKCSRKLSVWMHSIIPVQTWLHLTTAYFSNKCLQMIHKSVSSIC